MVFVIGISLGCATFPVFVSDGPAFNVFMSQAKISFLVDMVIDLLAAQLRCYNLYASLIQVGGENWIIPQLLQFIDFDVALSIF